MNTPALIVHARRSAGLSQRQLAARAGVPQPRIAEYESGRAVPRADRLDALLRACGRQLVAISADAVDGDSVTEEDRQLLTIHGAMTPAQRLATFSRRSRLRGAARTAD